MDEHSGVSLEILEETRTVYRMKRVSTINKKYLQVVKTISVLSICTYLYTFDHIRKEEDSIFTPENKYT